MEEEKELDLEKATLLKNKVEKIQEKGFYDYSDPSLCLSKDDLNLLISMAEGTEYLLTESNNLYFSTDLPNGYESELYTEHDIDTVDAEYIIKTLKIANDIFVKQTCWSGEVKKVHEDGYCFHGNSDPYASVTNVNGFPLTDEQPMPNDWWFPYDLSSADIEFSSDKVKALTNINIGQLLEQLIESAELSSQTKSTEELEQELASLLASNEQKRKDLEEAKKRGLIRKILAEKQKGAELDKQLSSLAQHKQPDLWEL